MLTSFTVFGIAAGIKNENRVNAAGSSSVTYTVASKTSVTTSGTIMEGTNATFENTYTTANQIINNNSMTLTISGHTSSYKIKSLTMSMKSNSSKGSSKGAGGLVFKLGSDEKTIVTTGTTFNQFGDDTSYGTTWRDVHFSNAVDFVIEKDKSFSIILSATVNSLYCQSFTIEYSEINSPLASIALSGQKTQYNVGDELVFTGTCLATYEDGSTKEVTPTIIGNVDMTTTGTKTVEVSYSEDGVTKTASYVITVIQINLTSIALFGEIEKKNYSVGDKWDLTGLKLQLNWDVIDPTYLELDDENVAYECQPETATDTSVTSFSLYVLYKDKELNETISGLTVELVETDVITASDLAATSTTYANFSNVKKNTAIYAGNTAKDSSNIQIRSKNSSGIVTTTSGGTLKSISITFATNTPSGRVIDVYAKNSAYTESADLYDNDNNEGTKVTSLTYSTTNSGTKYTYEFETDYEYIGIRSKSLAIYISEISISWIPKASSFGTLNHIKVTTLPNKTDYLVGETFVPDGLVVTAYDAVDEETANKIVVLHNDANLTIVHDETFTTVGENEILLEYEKDGKTAGTSFNVTVHGLRRFEKIIAPLTDWSGSYIITSSNDNKIFNSNVNTLDSTDNASDITMADNIISNYVFNTFTIEKISNSDSESDLYTIKSNKGLYIGNTKADNTLMSSDTTQYTNSISFENGSATITASGGYKLNFNAQAKRFRYYSSGSVNLYRLVNDDAETFSTSIINDLTCDPTGATAPSLDEWNLLQELYLTLANEAKEYLLTSGASESGSTIQKALAKYEYIISKYGNQYTNFIGREVNASNMSKLSITKATNRNISIVLVIVTMSTLTTFLGLYLLRKKKEQ